MSTAIAVAATPVTLTVTSLATAVEAAVYTLAGEPLTASITATAQITPSGIAPAASLATYSPVIIAVRTSGRIEISPPPVPTPSTYVEPPRLLPVVVATMPTPAIVNGKPTSPAFMATFPLNATVT